MPVTHLTLANKLRSLDPEAYDQLLGEIKAMTEPSVEEIVVKAEQGWSLGNEDTLRLIASWRERGKVIEQMQARYEGVQKTMSANDLQQAYDSMKP